MYGYMGKLLFVNLTDGTIETRPLKEEDARNFIGGPALGAKILYDEMPAKTDVFGPDSMIGFVGGPLNNTPAFFGGRYTVVCKSPVTGGWNDANSGGYFAPMLRKAGYDGVFVKGISQKPVYLFIDDGKVEIRDASALWGKVVSETEAALKKEHGDKINAALIGPAGENLSYFAAVLNDAHRAAGRGGCGAVMGSKKLKAIVVKGDQKTPVADPEALKAINKEIASFIKDGPVAPVVGMMGTLGTTLFYNGSTQSGDSGIKNWGGSGVNDYPSDKAYPISGENMEQFKKGKYNCANCPIGCGAELNVPSKRWDLSNTYRPEYETEAAFGSMMLNSDLESVCRCNNLCNEYGFDTISAGATLAWAMECYNNGVLLKEDLDGVDFKWGDGDAIVALMDKLCKNEGVGKILALGSRAAAEKFGKGKEYIVASQGIEPGQHDGKLSAGYARAFAFDPTPGRHTKGNLPTPTIDPAYSDRLTGFRDMRITSDTELVNASGGCLFAMMFGYPPGSLAGLITASTGFKYTPAEVNALGTRSFAMRTAFNLREGINRKNCVMSKRMYDGTGIGGPLDGMKVDVERWGDNFYNALGYDLDGVPLKESLEMIGGLDNVIKDLYPA